MCWIRYLGVEKDFAEQPTIIALPYKKQRNQQEISAEEEKEHKKIHSTKKEDSNRAYHLSIKKVQSILAHIFRNKLRRYNKVSDTVAGLINYRTINHSR
jgi:predicted transposase YbfD/YdcC